MERITVPGPDGGFSVPAGLEQEAAERLGRYEDAYERLTARRSELAGRMEALKAQGKQKTAQFRELFAEKLTIQNTLTLWTAVWSRWSFRSSASAPNSETPLPFEN